MYHEAQSPCPILDLDLIDTSVDAQLRLDQQLSQFDSQSRDD